ncbi:hypothetical protein CMI38_01255 [Candidatus Pacearchaeota archaeon]|nr:hypothetical protein [Candidatus Pacearchaeota archaeon]|tara:strand:+ start:425 stop:937 length:513 start_codon:yes stop_codon:yes gene_type:complete
MAIVFYQYAGFYGYSIGDVLNTWADMGIFAYALPFLMIFALVYGILDRTGILGNNRGVNSTIALAFGLLALQFDYVSGFYASIFPYAGMGLAVLLIAMIFLGLTGDQGGVNKTWLGIGVVIGLIVLVSAVSDMFWLGGTAAGLVGAMPALIAIGIIVGLMFWVMKSGGGN